MNKSIGQSLDGDEDFFFWINHAVGSLNVLRAAVEIDLCAHLGDEPVSLDVLAKRCDVPADKLGRIVNYLAAEEIVELSSDGMVTATARSRRMQELKPAITCVSMGAEAGTMIAPGLKQGKTAFEMRFGKPVFEYLGENPKLAAIFGSFMVHLTQRLEKFVFSQHSFEPFSVAADIGGSHGQLLLGLLARHPDARGILFDLPEVTAQVESAVRAAPNGERVEIVGGSFFDGVPAADLYLVKMVLHDWDDEECTAILKSIRAAIVPGGRIAVIDYLLPEVPVPSDGLDMDIAMMVWDTGRERKLSEFEVLFEAGGFKLERVSENPHGQSVIEAVPV